MRKFARGVAMAALAGMIGGHAFGQEAVEVKDAPVHKIDAGAGEPPRDELVEPLAPPNTLNAQFAAEKVSAETAKVEKVAAKDLKVVPLNAPPPEPPAAKPAPASKPVTLAKAEPKPAPKPRPAPVEGPTVDFAPSLIDAAGAFGGYVARAGAIDGKFPNGAAIGKAVATSSAYETHQFQEGMVAYAALVALQEPGFVQAVWDLGRDARDRDDIAKALMADPKSVLGIEGADAAAATVSGVLAQMGAGLVKAGTSARKAAYDVQKEAWSSEAAPEPQKRLADSKALSQARSAMSEEDTAALMTSLVAMRKAGPALGGRAPAPTAVVARGLALAAMAVLGRAGEEDVASLQPLLTDAKSEDCMKMAKLNLYQCLAVAGPHYEHAFCLGQHALMDTGQCVIGAAGQSPIPAALPVSAPVKKSRSIAVPFALSTPAGPERSTAYARPQAPQSAPAPPAEEQEAADEAPVELALAEPPAPAVAPPPPQVRRPQVQEPREDRYANGDRYARDDEDDRYAEEADEAPAYAQPQRPIRRAERDDRYQPYNPYQGYARDPREYQQDYDPYASPYYGRMPPPGYAYRFGR
jgi:hypothetical protein